MCAKRNRIDLCSDKKKNGLAKYNNNDNSLVATLNLVKLVYYFSRLILIMRVRL